MGLIALHKGARRQGKCERFAAGGLSYSCHSAKWWKDRTIMLDIVFIGATALFFVIAVLYVRGCERLKQAKRV
jgi:hypothetical protein